MDSEILYYLSHKREVSRGHAHVSVSDRCEIVKLSMDARFVEVVDIQSALMKHGLI